MTSLNVTFFQKWSEEMTRHAQALSVLVTGVANGEKVESTSTPVPRSVASPAKEKVSLPESQVDPKAASPKSRLSKEAHPCAWPECKKSGYRSVVVEGVAQWYCGGEKSGHYKSMVAKQQKLLEKNVKTAIETSDVKPEKLGAKEKTKLKENIASDKVQAQIKRIAEKTEIKEGVGVNQEAIHQRTTSHESDLSNDSSSSVSLEPIPSAQKEVVSIPAKEVIETWLKSQTQPVTASVIAKAVSLSTKEVNPMLYAGAKTGQYLRTEVEGQAAPLWSVKKEEPAPTKKPKEAKLIEPKEAKVSESKVVKEATPAKSKKSKEAKAVVTKVTESQLVKEATPIKSKKVKEAKVVESEPKPAKVSETKPAKVAESKSVSTKGKDPKGTIKEAPAVPPTVVAEAFKKAVEESAPVSASGSEDESSSVSLEPVTEKKPIAKKILATNLSSKKKPTVAASSSGSGSDDDVSGESLDESASVLSESSSASLSEA